VKVIPISRGKKSRNAIKWQTPGAENHSRLAGEEERGTVEETRPTREKACMRSWPATSPMNKAACRQESQTPETRKRLQLVVHFSKKEGKRKINGRRGGGAPKTCLCCSKNEAPSPREIPGQGSPYFTAPWIPPSARKKEGKPLERGPFVPLSIQKRR